MRKDVEENSNLWYSINMKEKKFSIGQRVEVHGAPAFVVEVEKDGFVVVCDEDGRTCKVSAKWVD